MNGIINSDNVICDEVLNLLAHVPTKSISCIFDETLFEKFEDEHYMRIATFLAEKSYHEGGCPIGGVVVDNETKKIVGKGHNTLVQENDPYNHGETAAIKDAGRLDFSKCTIYTTLSPCDICATLIYMRSFTRVVVGDVTNASGNEDMIREKGIKVDISEDQKVIDLYAKYRKEKPELDMEDWKGKAALNSCD